MHFIRLFCDSCVCFESRVKVLLYCLLQTAFKIRAKVVSQRSELLIENRPTVLASPEFSEYGGAFTVSINRVDYWLGQYCFLILVATLVPSEICCCSGTIVHYFLLVHLCQSLLLHLCQELNLNSFIIFLRLIINTTRLDDSLYRLYMPHLQSISSQA
jgi:hypothetical protein